MMRALVIRHPWIDKILDGEKTWEIRGSRTKVREQIGLIASRSGTVVGVCNLVGCKGPLTPEEFRRNARKAGLRPSQATLDYYRETFAWVLQNARRLRRPVPYMHPPGAVIWVILETVAENEIKAELVGRRPGRATRSS